MKKYIKMIKQGAIKKKKKEELPWDKENNIELNSYIAYLFRRKEND